MRGPGFTFDLFVSFFGLLARLINLNLLYLSQKLFMRLEKIQRRSLVILVALCEI